MKINVLVTAGGSAISQGIIKSIKKSGLDCNIIVSDVTPYAAGLYRANKAYIVPFAKDQGYIDKIIEICKEEKVDIIFIGLDYELKKLSENKERIEKESGAKVVVSSPDIIAISDDKWLTHKFLLDNGFPTIPSCLWEDVDALVEKEGFPLIVKPRIGDSSKNTFIVNNREELNEKIDFLLGEARNNKWLENPVDPIIQKYIGDEKNEFTSTTLVFDGRCYGVIPMKREMRFGGHTTKAEIKEFSSVGDYIRKVAEKLNPFGPCNFQARVVDGIPYIFEINCRFSGTIATCTIAGFNSVEACIRKMVLKEEIKDLSYRKGIMLRYFNEIFIPLEEVEKLEREGKLSNPNSEVNLI